MKQGSLTMIQTHSTHISTGKNANALKNVKEPVEQLTETIHHIMAWHGRI